MQLGSSFSSLKPAESKGFTPVNKSGQVLVITSVEDGTSKSTGYPMLTISHDIAEGEFAGQFAKYPLKKYLVYNDDKQLAKLKANFLKIINENKGMFPEDNPFGDGEFDEQRLIGCRIGADLDYNDNGYAEIRWYTSIEDAIANDRVITKPKKKEDPKQSDTSAPATAWGFGN